MGNRRPAPEPGRNITHGTWQGYSTQDAGLAAYLLVAVLSWPQVQFSHVQSTHVQFGLSHFFFSVSAIVFSSVV